MTKERERYQVIISLGEGTAGADKRKALEKAASRAGIQAVSVWCKRVLFAAANISPEESFVRRADHQALEERVALLERLLEIDKAPPLPPRARTPRGS